MALWQPIAAAGWGNAIGWQYPKTTMIGSRMKTPLCSIPLPFIPLPVLTVIPLGIPHSAFRVSRFKLVGAFPGAEPENSRPIRHETIVTV